MIDPQVIFDKLVQFETADDLAEFFAHQQVKAIPNSSSFCAISQYMEQETGLRALTNYHTITVQADNHELRWENTDIMKQFINRFDDVVYPYLVDKDWLEESGFND